VAGGTTNPELKEVQAQAIRDELRHILSSPAFAGSKRCQEFLQFVVDRALTGELDGLKERTIGAKLFGRDIGYETATDPIVRVKANDVRRRLTRYNLEIGDRAPVTILLPSGSYVPEFNFPTASSQPVSGPAQDIQSAPRQTPDPPTKRVTLSPRLTVAAVILVIAIVGGALLSTGLRRSDLERFWEPTLQGNGPVMVCFGRTYSIWLSDRVQKAIEEHPQSVSINPGEYYRTFDNMTSAGNIRAALVIVSLLQKMKMPADVLWASEARANDLRDRSVVLLGAFNNPWTLDLNKEVRFVFEHETQGDQLLWVIRDRKMKNRKWTLATTFPQPVDRDYAIITRIIDRERRRVVISAGGMNHFGTQVAAEDLCDPVFWREIAGSGGRDWDKKNLQVVLETEIVGGKPVRPRIIDSYFW
jgi:hypothetical protein